MVKSGTLPTIDLAAGAAALEKDIPRVLDLLEAPSLEALGWSRPNKTVLLVPMQAGPPGAQEHFLLRLGFQAYRTCPPSAQFVNPVTKAFAPPDDRIHVPKLTSDECRTHINYQPQNIQLICCSATLEFYNVLHSVEAKHLWRETDTFLTTITAIQRAMASTYSGRFNVDGN